MNNPQTKILSTIPYTVVERYIEKFEQKMKTTIHHITIDAEKIQTANYTFQIKNVFDISYKPFSGNNGLFYLHTFQGVITFQIEDNPTDFINTYKELRNA